MKLILSKFYKTKSYVTGYNEFFQLNKAFLLAEVKGTDKIYFYSKTPYSNDQ